MFAGKTLRWFQVMHKPRASASEQRRCANKRQVLINDDDRRRRGRRKSEGPRGSLVGAALELIA